MAEVKIGNICTKKVAEKFVENADKLFRATYIGGRKGFEVVKAPGRGSFDIWVRVRDWDDEEEGPFAEFLLQFLAFRTFGEFV